MNLQEKIQEQQRRKAFARAWDASADVLTGEIENEAREWYARTGTRPSWSVPEVADVVLPLSRPAVVITDIDALRTWTKATHPDNIRTVEEVRPSFQKWLIENGRITSQGTVVHPDTNEVIPGLTVREGGIPGSLRITPDPTAKAVLSAYADREVARQVADDLGEPAPEAVPDER